MGQQGDASVEEILESIKKVIARDNRAGAMETRRRRETSGVRDTAPAADECEDVLDLSKAELADEELVENDDESLTSEAVRASMKENLAALAMLAEPGAQPQIVRSGETSLEGMVRDMLRPMLAEWLDTHLPSIVEKLVRDEISRIAGKHD